jgi:acetyltransferase-like isoleucine patch superfamily enzyme
MQTFSERLIQNNPDKAVQEETRRSIQQRGLLGHYLAGAYRVFGRPIAQWKIRQKAKLLYFLWGMDEVANYIEVLPERYLNAVLRDFGATVAENAVVGDGLRFATVHGIGLGKLNIGYKVHFGRRCMIDMSSEVSFGDFCILGNDTRFISHTDLAHSPLKAQISPVKNGPVRIGRGVFVSSNTMIAHSVTIGECSIVGANSFVDKHVPPFTFAAGTPAKVLARINPDKVSAFDPAFNRVIPEGSTASDFDYENPRSLKIPENCGMIGADDR